MTSFDGGFHQQGGGAPGGQAPTTGGFGQPAQQPGGNSLNLGLILALAITLLGLVNYFVSFGQAAAPVETHVLLLLAGGLLAALCVLPNAPKVLPVSVMLSVLGGLGILAYVIRVPSAPDVPNLPGAPAVEAPDSGLPGVVIMLVIFGLLQAAVAVAALLFEHNIIKLPQPKPQPQYPYQPQQYGQPGQYGANQPTQFTQQPQQQAPGSGPQATQYAPQQGQFFQQPPAEPGPGQQQPGSNPGGNPS